MQHIHVPRGLDVEDVIFTHNTRVEILGRVLPATLFFATVRFRYYIAKGGGLKNHIADRGTTVHDTKNQNYLSWGQ